MFRKVLEEQGATGLALRAAGGCALEEMEAIAEVKEMEAKMSKMRG